MARRGAVETVADGHAQRGVPGEFLAHALVDEHVGVDRHADRQRQPGDARQGEVRVNRDHDGHQQDQVHHDRGAGDDARETVVDDHEDEHHEHGRGPRRSCPARSCRGRAWDRWPVC